MSFLGILTGIGSKIMLGVKWLGAAIMVIPTPVKAIAGIAAALIPAGIGAFKAIKRYRENKKTPMSMIERSLTGDNVDGVNDVAYTKTVESISKNIGSGNKKLKKQNLFSEISERLDKMASDESDDRAAYAEMRRIRDKRKKMAQKKQREEDPLFA